MWAARVCNGAVSWHRGSGQAVGSPESHPEARLLQGFHGAPPGTERMAPAEVGGSPVLAIDDSRQARPLLCPPHAVWPAWHVMFAILQRLRVHVTRLRRSSSPHLDCVSTNRVTAKSELL